MSCNGGDTLYNKTLRYLIEEKRIYTEIPEILYSLDKSQVMDVIEALCVEAVDRQWFSIGGRPLPYANVGFDYLFLGVTMCGSPDKIYESSFESLHPLTVLFKQYYDLYELDSWYKEKRLIWYQNLVSSKIGRRKLYGFSQENKFISLLAYFFEIPVYSDILLTGKPDGVWEWNPQDIFFNGAIVWTNGTNDLSTYGKLKKSVIYRPFIKDRRRVSDFDIVTPIDVYFQRFEQFNKVKEVLKQYNMLNPYLVKAGVNQYRKNKGNEGNKDDKGSKGSKS